MLLMAVPSVELYILMVLHFLSKHTDIFCRLVFVVDALERVHFI